jgi:hypothetical protein
MTVCQPVNAEKLRFRQRVQRRGTNDVAANIRVEGQSHTRGARVRRVRIEQYRAAAAAATAAVDAFARERGPVRLERLHFRI